MFDTLAALPATAESFSNSSWAQIAPYYNDLLSRPLAASLVDEWLSDWTSIAALVDETSTRFMIRTTTNTADAQAQREYTKFLEDILPNVMEAEQKVKQKLLESELEPAGFELPLRKLRTDTALYAPANVPLLAQERKLSLAYDAISGARTVHWEGREIPLVQLSAVLQENDRTRRELAWRTIQARIIGDTEQLTALWSNLVRTRQAIATNASYASYREYRWQQLYRFDYTPADAKAFDEAIAEVVVPAAQRIAERRRQRLGVDSLRPWDVDCDPDGLPALRPYTTLTELQDGLGRIFQQVSPRFAGYFDLMRQDGLLDLESREHKASGGYQLELAAIRKPFIFTNAIGTQDDVETLLHEGGHAFHAFETAELPYLQQRSEQMVPAEFAEVASMSMEFLGSPYLSALRGGFYSEADAARARIAHLESAIGLFAYVAMIDALQHWIYEHPDAAMDLAACDEVWASLADRYLPHLDWTGLEAEKRTLWHRILHVFQLPFYYIEYGLAQLGAIQVFANARRDQEAAVEAYRQALALGGTVALPQLFATAGAQFAFDAATLRTAVSLLEEVAAELAPLARP
ncbi:MAG: M3 family oligoendopeptidase [Ktedonobacterales bacterium]